MGRTDRPDGTDDAYMLAEMMAISECVNKNWARMGLISRADGTYLELHARQSGLFKQDNEGDEALRIRIQTPPLAITPDFIIQAIQQIVDVSGGGEVFMIELPRDSAYLDRGAFMDRGARIGGSTMIIVQVPLSADIRLAALDSLRARRAAGKLYAVEEYTL